MTVETIVAIATPPGRGGVGIIRVSGPLAYDIGLKLTEKNHANPREAYYSVFKNHQKEVLDQGLLLYFKAPHSFTGEDVIEIQVHGSPIMLDCIVKECVFYGATLAKPGEFSLRAFLNDKIDLTQAEAIADLIHSTSLTAARMSVRSLVGDFSKAIHELHEQLIHLRLYVEAAIDFPEEEIDFLGDGKIAVMLTEVIHRLENIKQNASQGAMVREGLSVVIAGAPNAGKSTLINSLANRDVAIVTDIPGTTRDVMREHILMDELPLHLIDTAGLRESDDIVEQEGVKRAWQEVTKADCILLVIDSQLNHVENDLDAAIKAAISADVPVIKVFNKIDIHSKSPSSSENEVAISAKTKQGLELLKKKIKEVVGFQPTEGQFIARRRHLDALERALTLLRTGQQQLHSHRAGELLAEDLRLAHDTLGEITGTFTSDDLLGRIFSSFCIGK